MVEYIKPAAIIGIPSLVVGALYASYQSVTSLPPAVFPQQDPFNKLRNAYELFRVCNTPFPGVVLPEFCEYTGAPFIVLNFAGAGIVTAVTGIILYRLYSNWKNSRRTHSVQV